LPSNRGELEITDVNNAYIGDGTMKLFVPGWMVDGCRHVRFAIAAANLVAQMAAKQQVSAELAAAVERNGSDLMAGEMAAEATGRRLASGGGLENWWFRSALRASAR